MISRDMNQTLTHTCDYSRLLGSKPVTQFGNIARMAEGWSMEALLV